jgi:hypothetical protein
MFVALFRRRTRRGREGGIVRSTRVYSPWPPPEEKSAEWFFQLFDALEAVATLLRSSRSKRLR